MDYELINMLKSRLERSNCSLIARETGLSVQTMHNIKTGKVLPRNATINVLCKYFLNN